MQYSRDDLRSCAITKSIFNQWVCEFYEESNIFDMEVTVNNNKINDPLKFFKDLESFINDKIDLHCKALIDLENYINDLAEAKVNELYEDKIHDLQILLNRELD